ncbi:IDEAL domain-containing protein [Clostridium sp. cel8]|jgi:hypothetical protein|uniref:IDEAL domain-containing protein n=1 Tax=unclassified Clostridium TaxID=2614128 RepID=UPI0015F4BAB7|nr:IDEAL domain-containing protein [Clostridium sp. cel8]MBA5850812.1 IDEAL domain-containing protein [Clostridium sp. cel8]
MKGELLKFDDVKNLGTNSKVWVIWKEESSDIYIIKKLKYGIDFVKYYSPSNWISFFMTYTALEYSMENGIVEIYKWVSNKEYIENGLMVIKSAIDNSLDMNNKDEFMRLTKKYNKFLEESFLEESELRK